ncbi:MAG TPA: choice-of-anchor Q domain-containing protein [Gemmataceae bacterium]|nr:choice-of-anchor Q domain-containing protein [Gemmataceae bacterium]
MSRLLRRLFSRPVAAPRSPRKVRRASDLRARLLVSPLEGRIAPATFTVTDAGDGPAPPVNTLRWAIGQANSTAGADTINFGAGVSTINLNSGQLLISESVTFNGTGVTVDAQGQSRVFEINRTFTAGPPTVPGPQSVVVFNGMTIKGGQIGTGNGAGIVMDALAVRNAAGTVTGYVNENVTLNNCVVTGNTTTTGVTNGAGIGVGFYGTLTINNSTISGNSTSGAGGGIYCGYNAQLTITNSTISGNVANSAGGTGGSGGGGIYFYGYPLGTGVTLRNTTISGNSAFNGGGIQFRALTSYGPGVNIQNCTITNNIATSTNTNAGLAGGGIGKTSGSAGINLVSSIVSGNTAPNAPAARADLSVAGSGRINASFSAIGVDPGPLMLTSPSNGNLNFGANLALGPLSNNGGPVQTHALGAASLAIDHGSNPGSAPNDARGQPRAIGNAADIGAFESTGTFPVSLGNVADVTASGATTYTFTVQYVDSTGISVSTLNTNDIRVTGPGGFNQIATFVSVDVGTNGSPRTATYRITPPGGSWDNADNGTYQASLQAGEVLSVGGVAVPAAPVGSFRALINLTPVVTNANDSGAGSLRQAILDANAANTPDTITFDPTFFNVARTINLATELPISDSLTITGPGAGLLTIRPNTGVTNTRIFNINGTSVAFNGSGTLSVTLSGMTLTGGNTTGGVAGNTTGDGGAILDANETVILNDMVITGNNAGTGQGGAIATNGGFIQLNRTTISGNSASTGGAIYFLNNGNNNNSNFGQLSVQNSTISGNTATGATTRGSGGGVYFFGYIPTATGFLVRNSTISGNSAAANGGGMYIYTTGPANNGNTTGARTISIQNTTITGNTAAGTTPDPFGGGGVGGGGIAQRYAPYLFAAGVKAVPATLTITSSIISGNSNPVAPDLTQPTNPRNGNPGTVNLTNSAVGSASGFTPSAASANNLPTGAALNLGPLANNGGPTFTHALLAGSAAIDKGAIPAGVTLTTDQRGTGFPRLVGPAVDIGAYEVQATGSPASVQSATVNAGQANTTQRSQVTSITVTFSTTVTFNGPPQTNAFQLTRTGPGTPNGNVTLAVDLTGSTATQTVAKLTFSGALTEGSATTPSLIDGNYTLTVLSSGISVGLTGGNFTTNLSRLFGDIDGNKTVNGTDLNAFRAAFGTASTDANYVSFLDFDGNGAINGTDLTAFRNRFGVILP